MRESATLDSTLHEALERLVAEGRLDEIQARAVLDEVEHLGAHPTYPSTTRRAPAPAPPPERGERLVAMLTYLGGALVLGAVVVIASLLWRDLSQLSRVALSLAATATLLAVATALTPWSHGAGLPWRGPREALSSTLAAFAAATLGLAAGVTFEDDPLLPGGLTGLVAAIGLYAVWRGYALVLAAFAGAATVLGWTIEHYEIYDSALAVSVLTIAFGVATVLVGRLVPEHLATDTAGSLAVVVGLQTMASWEHLAVYGLVASLAFIAVMFGLYLADRGPQFALVGGLGALILPTAALGTLTDSALAVGLTLLTVGLLLIVGAVFVVRRRSDE
jgi:hypothetical protein